MRPKEREQLSANRQRPEKIRRVRYFRLFPERLRARHFERHSRVIDQNVQPPMLLLQMRGENVDRFRIVQIQWVKSDFAMFIAGQFLFDRLNRCK